jgi:hypothetical protein
MARPAVGIRTFRIAAIAFLLSATLGATPPGPPCDGSVEVQVTTDRAIYGPGATMHVKLLVTNTSKGPLYLFHSIGLCSSPYGSLTVKLYDHENRPADTSGCSNDDFGMDKRDLVGLLNKSKSAVLLNGGDIYGQKQDYRLPKRKGTYWVRGVLGPVGFLTDAQKQALARDHMTILHSACASRAVRITVR